MKALIGIAPNGCITYVSDLYGGSRSDKEIVQHCGVLNMFVPGDMIMADKGFNIRSIWPSGVTLNIPSFLYNGQFTKDEIVNNKTIAIARIHVERAIQRIKIFDILDHIPGNLRQYADKIFKVCACLTNFQTSILAEVGTKFGELNSSMNCTIPHTDEEPESFDADVWNAIYLCLGYILFFLCMCKSDVLVYSIVLCTFI